MTSSSNGKQKPKNSTAKNSGSTQTLDQRFIDLDLKSFISPVSGNPVRVDQATDEEFDEFIRPYVTVQWTLEDRLQALAQALLDGHNIEFIEGKDAEKIGSGRANDPIFSGTESASQADGGKAK